MKLILKRFLCVFFAVLVICSPIIRTYRAHALALEASTVAAYAVFGTALAACGILIATSDVPVSDALAAGWDLTTDKIKDDIRTIKICAGITGSAVAHWTADKWGRFTKWVKDTFSPGDENTISIDKPVTFADTCLSQTSLDLKAAPRIGLIPGRDLSQYRHDINPNKESHIKFDWNSSGNIFASLLVGSAVLFSSAASGSIYKTMNSNFRSISVFQPIICGTVYLSIATAYQTDVVSLSQSSINKVTLSGWKLGTDCGNASYAGKTLVMDNGVLKAGNGGSAIAGKWTSIAEYIAACMDAGVVIGIPFSDGSTVNQDDVVNPAMDEIPVTVDADYFPDVGTLAPATDLPDGIGYDIPLPTTKEWTGDDVLVKDITDASPIDLPHIGELNPSEAQPRVRTDEKVTAANPYLTTAKTADIPTEIADETLAPPPGGGGGEDEENEDGNDLKLPALLITKFPFCIPHDFKCAIESLLADPQPPKFDFRLKIDSIKLDYTIPVNFSGFESLASLIRWLLSVFWVIILIRGTTRLINQ